MREMISLEILLSRMASKLSAELKEENFPEARSNVLPLHVQ